MIDFAPGEFAPQVGLVRVPASGIATRALGQPGTLGNPGGTGVSVTVGIGGLLLLVLAGYGIYRLARG